MIFPILESFVLQHGITVSPLVWNQLLLYKTLLVSTNKQFNLTSIVDDQGVELKHFFDSVWFPFPTGATSLLDVGSGAGFPGIPLHLFHPHLHTTLLEPQQKKAQFLKQAIKALTLSNMDVISERAEIWVQHHREQFDVVTARAVAPLRILLELTAPFVKVHGTLLLLKGPSAEQELGIAHEAMTMLDLSVLKIEKIVLPIINESRSVIYLTKNKATSSQYPRRYAHIKSKPL